MVQQVNTLAIRPSAELRPENHTVEKHPCKSSSDLYTCDHTLLNSGLEKWFRS